MGRFQRHECKDCGAPLYWDDDIRSEKTGNRIPLNENYETAHYRTCPARQQNQQQKHPYPIPSPRIETTHETEATIKQDVILARLDRIDESIKQIAKSLAFLAQFYDNKSLQLSEQEYDKDKEDGLTT